MRIAILIVAVVAAGCSQGYQDERDQIERLMGEAFQSAAQQTTDRAQRDALVLADRRFIMAASLRDSLIEQGPSIRYYDADLAQGDSAAYAHLLLSQISDLYYVVDTTLAVYAYLEALPWLQAVDVDLQIDEARRYAETAADALGETLSPNMARLAFNAFGQAEALALKTGDPELIALVAGSRVDVVNRLAYMPDSVRLAFAPSPTSQRAPLPTGLIAFIAFIALGTGAGGTRLWLKRRGGLASTSRAASEAASYPHDGYPHDGYPHGFVPYDVRYKHLSSAERCLEALWVLSFSYGEVPGAVMETVTANCRSFDHQRALFMAAGLMVAGLDYEPLKAAGLVRQRLLRFARRERKRAFYPGVLLPRDRAETRLWLERQFGTERPSQVADKWRT